MARADAGKPRRVRTDRALPSRLERPRRRGLPRKVNPFEAASVSRLDLNCRWTGRRDAGAHGSPVGVANPTAAQRSLARAQRAPSRPRSLGERPHRRQEPQKRSERGPCEAQIAGLDDGPPGSGRSWPQSSNRSTPTRSFPTVRNPQKHPGRLGPHSLRLAHRNARTRRPRAGTGRKSRRPGPDRPQSEPSGSWKPGGVIATDPGAGGLMACGVGALQPARHAARSRARISIGLRLLGSDSGHPSKRPENARRVKILYAAAPARLPKEADRSLSGRSARSRGS